MASGQNRHLHSNYGNQPLVWLVASLAQSRWHKHGRIIEPMGGKPCSTNRPGENHIVSSVLNGSAVKHNTAANNIGHAAPVEIMSPYKAQELI